jgi:hypothetical protein
MNSITTGPENCRKLPYEQKSSIWFSHRERRFDVMSILVKRIFKLTKNSKIWNWDNCFVSAIKLKDGKIRVIIRSSQLVDSDYRKRKVNLKYMLGFDITQIGNLEEDEYDEPIGNLTHEQGAPRHRWYFQLDKDRFLWQWKETDKSKLNSELAGVWEELTNIQNQPYDPTKNETFNVHVKQDDNRIIPTIYQPAIDTWKNFLREVHCNKLENNQIQVTLLFNDEHLRKHKSLDRIYRLLRLILYRRIVDLETFIVNLDNGIPNKFEFPNIYSGEKGIEHDNVHADGAFHKIKYFFGSKNHPIVFINTANHAMSYHDTNHTIWKWEYTPWDEDSPIIFGNMSREELESCQWEIYSDKWINRRAN